MDWEVKFESYEKQGTMPLDRAKIEALRAIAEQLEKQNILSMRIEQLEKLAEEYERRIEDLEQRLDAFND